MNSATTREAELLAGKPAFRLSWLWILGTGAGALAGAGFALMVFPDAAFGRNPTGQFAWSLVGFALAIGVSIAIAQWAMLRYLPSYRESARLPLLALWIPVTSAAIVVMILPLWWAHADVLASASVTAVAMMLPGTILLGIGQWFVLRMVIAARAIWIPMTIAGVAVGTLVGLAGPFLMFHYYKVIPIDVIWCLATGAFIGAFQRPVLVADLNGDLRRLE